MTQFGYIADFPHPSQLNIGAQYTANVGGSIISFAITSNDQTTGQQEDILLQCSEFCAFRSHI